MHDGPLLNQSIDREARVVGAVLRDEFFEAAAAYADALIESERAGKIADIFQLMKKRERLITARAMLVSE